MPKVGKKKFPYTAEGKRAAAAYAKATNQKVEEDRKPKSKGKTKKGGY
jgi:hypothetical protein|tara:strand:- start:514 stop:657 length:144 start_codon:yes stop_codon:yes gene_type:complete